MHLLDNYSQTFLSTNQERSDKQRENLRIATFSLVSSKLNIGVQNTGDIPINITRLWVQNTTTTDWFGTYTVNTVVSPGTTASNIGQSIPLYINPANSYNIKLVTERGNSQQFALNSANSAPINIQLLAIPASLPSGLTTELVMVVTNNSTSTLTNIAPAPLPPPTYGGTMSGIASCVASSVSPTKYDTLAPGNSAIFKWDVTASGVAGDTCSFTASLQNGYPGNSAQAIITITTLRVTSTDWSTNTGIMTIQYTSFKWSQGYKWNTSWQMANGKTAFSLNITNNNATSGSNFYISNKTMLIFHQVGSSGDVKFFVTKQVDVSGAFPTITQPYTCSGFPQDDFCISLPPRGWAIVYFAATSSSGGTVQNLVGGSGQYLTYLAVYGKYSSSKSSTGNEYAQNLPYIAVNIP